MKSILGHKFEYLDKKNCLLWQISDCQFKQHLQMFKQRHRNSKEILTFLKFSEQNHVDNDGYVFASNVDEETLPPSFSNGYSVIWIHATTGYYFEDALLRAKEFLHQPETLEASIAFLYGSNAETKASGFCDASTYNGAEAEIVCYKVGNDSNFIQNCSRARRLLILITDEKSSNKIMELLKKAALDEKSKLHQIEGKEFQIIHRLFLFIAM